MSIHKTELCSYLFSFVLLTWLVFCLILLWLMAICLSGEQIFSSIENTFVYETYVCLLKCNISSVIMNKNSLVAYNMLNNVFMLQVSQEHSVK